jgi:hypothetical protein
MAKTILQTITTPVYNSQGQHVGDLTDEYFVDKRDGLHHPVQDPPRPTPPPVRPGGPLPPSPPPLPSSARRPYPETFACPRTLDLVTLVQQGQPLPPLSSPPPPVNHLACPTCHQVTCTCGTPPPPTGDAIVALQKARGTRH